MADAVGPLVIQIGADLAKLRGGLAQATGVLSGFARTAQSIGNQVKGVFAGIGVSAIAAAGRATLQFADDLVETADALGITTQRFQELQFAAQQSGVSVEQFRSGMGRLAKEAGEAGLTTERAFSIVVEKMRQAETQSEKVAIATAAFGRGAFQFALAFGDGGAAAEEMAAKLRSLGAVIDDAVLRRVAESNDRIDAFVRLIKGGLVVALDSVIPSIETLGAVFDRFKTKTASMLDEVGLSLERIGNRLQQWWLRLQLLIPDMMGKDAIQAQLGELQQMDQVLQRLQQGARGQAGGAVAIRGATTLGQAVRDLSMTQDEAAFFSGLGKTGGAGKSGRSGGRGGPDAYAEGLRHTNDLLEEESRRLDQLASRWEAVLSPMEKANLGFAKLEEELAGGKIGLELYQREYLALIESMQSGDSAVSKTGQQFETLGETIATSIATAVASARIDFKSLESTVKTTLASIAQAVASSLISKYVTGTIAGAIGSIFGGMAGGGSVSYGASGTGFLTDYGGLARRASGGPVLSGRAYLVGEQGPELFFPGASGQIAPGAGGATNVSISIQALDARSVATLLTENQGLIAGLVSGSYRKQGLSVRR